MGHALTRSTSSSLRVLPRARSWVVRQTLCFDSASHAFRHCDIEISGSRISALLPAGLSTLTDGADGSRFVCTPGLVGMETAPSHRASASPPIRPSCMTAVGIHGEAMRSLANSERAGPIRTVALPRFGGHYLEQVNGFLDWFLSASRGRFGDESDPPLTVMPVLSSAGLLSASEVVEFAKFAKTMGTRIGVQLSSTPDEAVEFRSRFYCSESALIGYLLAHEPNVTVFGASRMDRREALLLARMQCVASLGESSGVGDADVWRTYAPLFMQGRAALHVHGGEAQPLLSKVTSHAPASRLDRYADALTRCAALALGLSDVGALAPGMKADMCVFERDGEDDYRAGSATLLSLLGRRRPAFVVIDGKALPDEESVGTTYPAELAHA